MVKKFSNADDRPRIYIGRCKPAGYAWRIGIHMRPRFAGTPGEAFTQALAEVGDVDAVVFFGTLGGPE